MFHRRFRAAAVAIIAANRLKNLQGSGCRMFVTQDGVPGLLSATVCTGGVDEKHKAFKGTLMYAFINVYNVYM